MPSTPSSRPKQQHITVSEAARRAGVTRQLLYHYLSQKRIRGVKRPGGAWWVPWLLVVLTPDRSSVMKVHSSN